MTPKDDDGHGTAMLSLIHRIAPFADICVARIAGKDDDLKNNPQLTSSKLAEVCVHILLRQQIIINLPANAIGHRLSAGLPKSKMPISCLYP